MPAWTTEFAAEPPAGNAESAGDTGDAFLPGDLVDLIEKGVPPQGRLERRVSIMPSAGSAECRLVRRIASKRRIAGKPIVPERYANRLRWGNRALPAQEEDQGRGRGGKRSGFEHPEPRPAGNRGPGYAARPAAIRLQGCG